MISGMEVASLFARIGLETSDFSRGLQRAEKDLNAFQRGMSGLQSAVGTGLKLATGVGVAAIGGLTTGIGMAVNSAATMEQSAANISAVFGDMAPPVADVKDLINSLALDPSLVTGVAEASAGIEMLAKNGLDWETIANGAARSSILLSNATGADLATAADIATNAMSIFGLEISDLDGIVATFVNSANLSQFGVEDWGYALANAGPKAAAFGFELDDLFAAMTLTSGSFASGQNMGTSFAWMINGLVPNTDKAAEAMRELGLITEDGANQFFNADGTGKDLVSVIQLLQGAFGGLTTEQQMAYSRVIFGNEAFGALAGVLGINNEELNKLIPQMTDFSAVEAGAATRTNTFQAAMAQAGDTISSVLGIIGEAFIPVFTELVHGFSRFVQSNAPAISKWFSQFADVLSIAAKYIGAILEDGDYLNDWLTHLPKPIQDVVLAFHNIVTPISNFVATVKEIFVPVTDLIAQYVEWKDVLAAVGVVIASIVIPAIASFIAAIAPVIITFTALVAASAALRNAWENDWGGIQTKTKAVIDYLNSAFGPLLAAIREYGRDSLKEIVAWATGNETEFTATKKIWESAQESFSTVFGDMGEKLTEWGNTVWAEFKERFPKAAKALTDAYESISKSLGELWAVVKPLIDKATELFNAFVTDWKLGSENMSGAMKVAKIALDGIWATMITAMSGAITTLIDTLKLVVQLLNGDWRGAWQTAQGIYENTLGSWGTIATTVKDTVVGVLDALGVDFTGTIDAIETRVRSFWTWLTGLSFGGVFSGIAESFAGVVNLLLGWTWPAFPRFEWPSIPTPGWLNNFLDRVPGFASGGHTTFGGLALVGERGPELVNLPGGSHVYTNAQSMAMAGGGGHLTIDLNVRGESDLPSDRRKLRELAAALQRELQLSGARVLMA